MIIYVCIAVFGMALAICSNLLWSKRYGKQFITGEMIPRRKVYKNVSLCGFILFILAVTLDVSIFQIYNLQEVGFTPIFNHIFGYFLLRVCFRYDKDTTSTSNLKIVKRSLGLEPPCGVRHLQETEGRRRGQTKRNTCLRFFIEQSMNRTAPWSKLRLPIRGTPFLMWR